MRCVSYQQSVSFLLSMHAYMYRYIQCVDILNISIAMHNFIFKLYFLSYMYIYIIIHKNVC